ncbi:hypothetical protein Nepgr_031716 [Nepenthes gracilis]|uniref:Uncharacterized protein n=1 Tax=Nepenthes gracilis TaxID=150966 RepID=A0AAD3TJ06_NEPGR|nr:hypothetical protein Nepgr_031716 [Nepenthes gracilis]
MLLWVYVGELLLFPLFADVVSASARASCWSFLAEVFGMHGSWVVWLLGLQCGCADAPDMPYGLCVSEFPGWRLCAAQGMLAFQKRLLPCNLLLKWGDREFWGGSTSAEGWAIKLASDGLADERDRLRPLGRSLKNLDLSFGILRSGIFDAGFLLLLIMVWVFGLLWNIGGVSLAASRWCHLLILMKLEGGCWNVSTGRIEAHFFLPLHLCG